MSSAGKAAGEDAGIDSLATRFADSASCAVNKPEYRELDLGSPVSPLMARNSISGGATTTTTTSSSSSSSSGSVSGKMSPNASSDAETLQSAPSRTPRRGHRRSASAGAPLIYSSRSWTPNSSISGGGTASSNHHANVVGLSGNICPSGKISKANLTNASTSSLVWLRWQVLGRPLLVPVARGCVEMV